jgi:endonuclease/exonuclease/phosphatase family metal-dependent hydrolase
LPALRARRISLPMTYVPRLAAALFALFCGVGAHAQTVVRVLQYNIHRDIGGADSNTASQPALAKVINYLSPDVWTINELGGNNAGINFTTAHDTLVAFINTQLTVFGANPVEGQNYFIYLGQRTDGYIIQAIVSRYPFLSTQTYSDANSGYPALRGLVRAHIDLPGSVELGVFTAHLKALNSTTDAAKRQAEATADAATVASWMAAQGGDGAVMTGDFNESEEPGDADNWSGLSTIGDPITMADGTTQIYRPITTLRGAALDDAGPTSIKGNRDTIDATTPDARFDYILHRSSHLTYLSGQVFDTKQHTAVQLSTLNVANGTSFVVADSASASDHLPVLEVFLASPGPGYVAAQSASSLASTTTTLNATINPNGFATTWKIELGTTTAYGLTSFSQTIAAGRVNADVAFNVAGLAPGTIYHFRVVTQNSVGTSVGTDRTFTTAAFVDSDGDEIPNDWETAQGLNPNLASDAALDADGDGTNNRDEYRAGTNPRSTSSVFRITSIVRTGSDFVISWPSIFGKRYQLETRPSYTSGSWTSLQTNLPGTGATMSATDTGVAPAATQRLYRVVTVP